MDSIRRDIIAGGPDALTYDMVVSTVSAYWVTFGKSSSTVIRQLNVGIKDTASAPPDLQTQFDAMKFENDALKKVNNDTSTLMSSSKPNARK